MRSVPTRRAPGVLLVLLVIGVVLVTPVAAIGWNSVDQADRTLVVTEAAGSQVDTLQRLIRLAPAIGAEGTASGVRLGASGDTPVLPASALAGTGFNFEDGLEKARDELDETIAVVGDAGLTERITAARTDVDAGALSVPEVLAAYRAIAADLDRQIDVATTALTASAVEFPSADLLRSVEIASLLTDLQLAAGEQLNLYVTLYAPYFERSVEDVRRLSDSLTTTETIASDLDDLIPPTSPTGLLWAPWRNDDATRRLAADYAETVRERTAAGLPLVPVRPDLATMDLDAMIARFTRSIEISDRSADSLAGIPPVITAALDAVDTSVATAEADAAAARIRTIAIAVGLAALLGISTLTVMILIVRPVGRMAYVAESLRAGRLDARMAETGPHEIRTAAHAMNEAITALETTEAQAVALAEERLDDPILSQPAVGRLGASLQSAVSRLASSLNEREGFQRRLAHEASHDGLTKLPNRNAVLVSLQSALARTRRSSTSLALLFLDLDDFKSINDLHGHQFGDSVLRTIATRLSAAIREGDLAGRLGGDEFVVVAEPVDGIEDAIVLSDRILDMVGAPITIGSTTIVPSVSIGIGIADDADLTADELLRDADLAVYRAKSLGKGRVDVCDEALRNEMRERTTLEQAIQNAITNDELVVQFQPTVDTTTNEVSSLEALVRWERPGYGLVSPDEFIPVAERSDLIIQLDRWVLCTVAARLSLWTNHPTLGSLPISVNVSARHLSSGSLADEVDQILAVHDVAPDRVILEVTETALLEDIVAAAAELARLRHTGIRIALDDFGTGYLSLAHLRGLPVDVIKIDRSFVSKIDSRAERSLIKLIVDTGHVLGAAVTAEGVETNDQAQVLADFGSDYLQGYLFSRPVDPANIETLMESGPHPVQRTEYFEPAPDTVQAPASGVSEDHATSR